MSGCPYENDLYIGCVFVNEVFIGDFITEFYDNFPELKRFDKKATNLHKDKLKEIIAFMDKKRIKMTCIKFHKHKLEKYYKEIVTKKNQFRMKGKSTLYSFKERLLGILYYYLVKPLAYKKWHYGFEMCVESHLNTLPLLRVLNDLSHKNEYYIHPRLNYRRIQHMLKFADFVAGAGNKLDRFVLRNFKYFNYMVPEIDSYDSDKIFGIKDAQYETKKFIKFKVLDKSSEGAMRKDSQ